MNKEEAKKHKVKLPREVGEGLEDWLAVDDVDGILHDLTSDLISPQDDGHGAVHRWWNSTLSATYLIADMARYGWDAEPEAKEKKYYVKVPLVQAQGGLWFYINGDDKLDASFIPLLANKFTMDEIEEKGLQDCEKVWCDSDD